MFSPGGGRGLLARFVAKPFNMSTTTTKPKIISCKQPTAVLTTDTWHSRVSAFMTSGKYTVLNKRVNNAVKKKLVAVFKLDLQGFIDLLGKFTAPEYNGIRMHFGCYPDTPTSSGPIRTPPNMEGQLCVFFCPTTGPEGGNPTGFDDPKQFWYLGPSGAAFQPDMGTVTNYINHYKKNRKDVLQTDGEDHMKSKKFKETERLWYGMETIAGKKDGDVGLLPYLACQIESDADNPIIELYIQLSAFTPMDKKFPEYQLSSVFYFRQASDPVPDPNGLTGTEHGFVFGSASLPIDMVPADTGIPCPPADNCPPPPPTVHKS